MYLIYWLCQSKIILYPNIETKYKTKMVSKLQYKIETISKLNLYKLTQASKNVILYKL